MSGMIQTVGSQFSGINYQGISKFCGKWGGRAIDFFQTIPTRVGPENLKVGGAFLVTNLFCYLLTSKIIASVEKRFEIHDIVSGPLSDSQKELKQGLLNGVIPITLTVLFNVALGKVIKHELSLTALVAVAATVVMIRHLFNRPTPPEGAPPADLAGTTAGPNPPPVDPAGTPADPAEAPSADPAGTPADPAEAPSVDPAEAPSVDPAGTPAGPNPAEGPQPAPEAENPPVDPPQPNSVDPAGN